MTKDYEGFSKEELIKWIELCHDLLTQKGVTDNNHGALYSIYGRFGLYVDYNEARIAALESRLREAEAVIKPFADNAIVFEDKGDNQEAWGSPNMDVLVSDFRRAAAFLAGGDTNKV